MGDALIVAIQRKHKIRAIRVVPVFSLRELRKRHKEAQENQPTAEQLRNMPDPLDPNFGKDWRK